MRCINKLYQLLIAGYSYAQIEKQRVCEREKKEVRRRENDTKIERERTDRKG